MEVVGYIVGVLMHVASKWCAWKSKTKAPWRDYWTDYAAVNLAGFIAAVPLMYLWSSGALPEVLRLVGQGIVATVAAVTGGTDFRVPTPDGFVAAMGAGYAMDSLARTAWLLVEGRRAAKEDTP